MTQRVNLLARGRVGRRRLTHTVCLVLLATTTRMAPAFSQDETDRIHRGQMSLTYQYFETDGLGTDTGTIPIGETDAHVLNFEVDYALNDRWTLSAGLPLISKRYQGSSPHTPWTIIPPHPESEFLDDGHFHTDFQDLHIGLRYLARTNPIAIEPFLFLGIPSHDYTFFAQAAVGPNLRRVEMGVALTYQSPFSNFFFSVTPGREFVEKTLGYDVDHWRLDAEVGYFVSPRLSVRAFISGRDGDGVTEFPRRDDELWYQHDRLTRHNYANVGVGMDWAVNERHRLTAALLRMAHKQDVHALKFAISIGISRAF